MATASDVKATDLERKSEAELSSMVDARIAKALGLKVSEIEDLPTEPGVMSTPSVLSTVRATVYVHC